MLDEKQLRTSMYSNGGFKQANLSYVSDNATHYDSARNMSAELFKEYDKDKSGEISNLALIQMLKDVYKLINRDYEPSQSDIEEFKVMLDLDKDGKKILILNILGKLLKNDIEHSMIRY